MCESAGDSVQRDAAGRLLCSAEAKDGWVRRHPWWVWPAEVGRLSFAALLRAVAPVVAKVLWARPTAANANAKARRQVDCASAPGQSWTAQVATALLRADARERGCGWWRRVDCSLLRGERPVARTAHCCEWLAVVMHAAEARLEQAGPSYRSLQQQEPVELAGLAWRPAQRIYLVRVQAR